MAMKPLSKAIGFAAMAMSGAVLADTPTLKDVLSASGITATGYVDASYVHQSIDPSQQITDSNGNPILVNYFDDHKDSFNLQQAAITLSSLPKEGFGALVNITGGNDADHIHSSGGSSSNLDITQAYVQYATGPLTAIAGKFNTLAGAELIDPTGNTNITRSIAFLNALPFTHTGIRFAYVPIDTLTLYAGINNGWDQQKDDNNEKTLELGFLFAPTSMVTWAGSLYNGKEPLDSTTNTNRRLFDTVLTVKPIDGLSLVLNYDNLTQENVSGSQDAKVTAWIGYINYAFTNEWHMSVRGEVFDDKDDFKFGFVDLSGTPDPITGELPASKKTKELTLTVGYAPSANFEIRGEVRQDKTDKEAFVTTSGGSTDKATTLALETYYKF